MPIAVITLMNCEVKIDERKAKQNEKAEYYFSVSHPEQKYVKNSPLPPSQNQILISFSCTQKRRVYVMMAASEEERQAWMQAIQTASRINEISDTLSLPPLIPLLAHPDPLIQRHAVVLISSFLTGYK